MKHIKPIAVIAAVSLAVIVFVIHTLCLTTPVQITKQGVLYNRESGEVTPVTLTMDGNLKRFVWRDDYFTGKLDFDGFSVYGDLVGNSPRLTGNELAGFFDRLKLYYEEFWTDAECWSYGRNTNSLITYKKDDLQINFMMLHMDDIEDIDKFSLVCPVRELDGNGGYWSSDTGHYLVFPAETQDDAEFAVRRMWDMYNEEFSPDMPIDE